MDHGHLIDLDDFFYLAVRDPSLTGYHSARLNMKFGVLCFSRPKDSPQATLGYVKCSGWWCGVELSASTPLVLQFEVRKPSTPSIMSNGASAELHANSATFFFWSASKET